MSSKQASKIDKLFEWAVSHGARFNNFQIESRGLYRGKQVLIEGAFATKEIPTDSEICYIPSKLLLSESVSLESPIVQSLNEWFGSHAEQKKLIGGEKYPHAIEMLFMAIFMVHHRIDEKSFWFPYLNSLPAHYNLPICWKTEKITALLEGTSLHFITIERIKWAEQVVSIVNEAVGHLFAPNAWTFDNFIWAFASISSRAFPKSRTETESDWVTLVEICLYPVLDMISWNMTDDGVSFVAGEDVLISQEVCNNYGPKGNENLLGNYGFVLENNPEDYYKIYINIRDEDPLASDKRECLKRVTPNSTIHLLFADELSFSESIMGVTRILVANQSELDLVNDESRHTRILSLRNEFTALKILFELVNQKYKLLVAGKFDSNIRDSGEDANAAYVYREGQIHALETTMSNLRNMGKKVLQMEIQDKTKAIESIDEECVALKNMEESIHSIFFSTSSPFIDHEFLDFISFPELDFDPVTILSLLAIKYATIPTLTHKHHMSILGESIEEYTEFFNDAIAPIFLESPDIFPAHIFNMDAMINMVCLLDIHGAFYSFDWMGCDIEAEGLFLDLKI